MAGLIQKRRTILFEVQEACKQLSLTSPTEVFTSLDETAILMGSLANNAGIMINDAFTWQSQVRAFSCVGDGTTKQFPLPTYIDRFIDQTGWSTATRRPVVILNAQQWSAVTAWLSQSFFINPAVRIAGDFMEFMSAPAVGETITFQYVSSAWVVDGANPLLTKEYCTIDADLPVWDWLLMIMATKVQYLVAKGFDSTGAQQDFNDRIKQLTQNDEVAPILLLNGQVAGGFRYLDNFYNSPDSGIGR